MKLLIVEDIGFSSFVVKNFVESLGHEAVVTPTGYEALDYLDEHKDVSAVICDLFLPDIDGLEVYKEASERHKGHPPPFILLTCSPNRQHLLQAESLGFIAAMEKPMNRLAMREVLQDVEAGNYSLKKTGDKSKILIVDSSGRNFDALQEVFMSSGYTLLSANNVAEAHRMLEEYSTLKAVITDLKLSDKNAMEFLTEYTEMPHYDPELPFILLTESRDDMELIQVASVSGFQDVILGPYEKSTLTQKLNKAFTGMGQSETHQQQSILIVDDLGFHGAHIKNLVQKSKLYDPDKHHIVTLTSSEEAYSRLLSDNSVFLIFLDLVMPELNGLDFYKRYQRFRQKNAAVMGAIPEPTFFMVTMSNKLEDLNQAKELGFRGVFRKPVNISTFLNEIDQVLGGAAHV